MATLDEEFDALPDAPSAKSLNDEFDALPDAPVAKAPEAPAPKPVEKTGVLAGLGKGMVEGFPGGYGPNIVAGIESVLPGGGTYEEELAKEKASLEKARAEAGVPFGVGEFVGELPTFVAGGALGKMAGGLATAGKALTPGLKAAEAAIRAMGLGGTAAAERLARTGDVGEAAVTGATTAALGPVFEGAGILARKLGPELGAGAVKTAVRRGAQAATLATPAAVLAKASYPEEGDTAAKTKWLLGQGLLAKEAATGVGEAIVSKARESIQPKLRRATAEGTALAREDVFKDVLADEATRNRQFRAAVKGEQRAMTDAEKIKRGDLSAIDKMAQDALDLDALVKGLGDGTDPSLRGLLGKLFQDTSNRLLRAKQALENRPELASQPLKEKIATVDRLITESYLKNTEKGGYLEDFNDDPYVRLEEIRKERLADAVRKRDRLSEQQASLLRRVGERNYLEEARAKQQKPAVPEARLRELATEAGLEYGGPDRPFGAPTRHRLQTSPEQQAELEAQAQGEFERQVKAGGRSLQGLSPEGEFGEKPPFFDIMNPSVARAATQPLLPDWVQPNVALRAITGPARATVRAPESEFKATQRIETAKRPTEDVMARPFNTVAMLRAWDKVLSAPSPATRGVLSRISKQLGIPEDRLLRTSMWRASALTQALQDPEVRKEIMSNVSAP
jgi:hypothetical protein